MSRATDAVQSKVFHVDRFRNPSLPQERRRELEAMEGAPLDLSVDAVLRDAKALTGLHDFGAMEFTGRLRRLLAEVAADENVWNAAKIRFAQFCVQAASNRLRIRAYLKAHADALQEEIDRPVFIAGLPRSGTTHLENLIAADPRLRHLPVFLGAEPAPTPGERPGADGKDPRWHRANEFWQQLKANPIMEAMHEHSPDHACGENELQMPDFASYQWEWLADVPEWRDFYCSEDQGPHYRYARDVLKLIAHQFPSPRRWILKGNALSEQLPVLHRVYPDAIIVMIHRDPLAILQSVLTMRGLGVLENQKNPDIRAHVDYWIRRIEHMLRAYVRDYRLVPETQRIDLLFQEILADDLGSARRVTEKAGLPGAERSEQAMRRYIADHPRGRKGRVVYDLAGNFDLNIGELRERFSFYADEFPVGQEVV